MNLPNLNPRILAAVLTTGLLAVSSQSFADWTLDNAGSQLHFMSIKSSSVAELHTFETLAGSLSDTGEARIVIDLNSVSTQVPIRDERMQTLLFDTENYAQAVITAQVDIHSAKALEPGQTELQPVNLTLDLHGHTQTLATALQVTGLEDGKLLVATSAPVPVNAEDFDLVAGINALRDVVGLPSITLAVPVTATLIFAP